MAKKAHEWDVVTAKRAALRYARALALKNLILLGRFKQIHPWSEDLNDCGPEWMAIDRYDGRKFVTVWYGCGEKDEANMMRDCDLVRVYGRYKFGISVRPVLQNLKLPGTKSAISASTILHACHQTTPA
jgi:hypothetical protein